MQGLLGATTESQLQLYEALEMWDSFDANNPIPTARDLSLPRSFTDWAEQAYTVDDVDGLLFGEKFASDEAIAELLPELIALAATGQIDLSKVNDISELLASLEGSSVSGSLSSDGFEALGGDRNDLVPFEKYANAALSLVNPSSAARALANGAPNIERVDRLVQTLASQNGMQSDVVDQTVELVDGWIEANRAKA